MGQTVISVDRVGKRYEIGRARPDTLRDSISGKIQNAIARAAGRAPVRRSQDEFWALRDVSFSVGAGEVVGVIGRNGAGKSTLLKVLSRITEPTTGRVGLRGLVASLLEVGTGFHPELSGRENIFLNGAILGMSRAEIRAKFDEIVAFAEVERFLETPVKHYSSGMYVRLAFSVAAHLEPEILIVDEVLAVGDIQFQKKCLAQMQSACRQEGRTILFVSHNLDSIQRLCSRVLWLDQGRLRAQGPTSEIISAYSQARKTAEKSVDLGSRKRESWLRQSVRFERLVDIESGDGAWIFGFGRGVVFDCLASLQRPCEELSIAYAIFNSSGVEIAGRRFPLETDRARLGRGGIQVTIQVPNLRLAPGSYGLNLGLASASGDEDFVADAVNFEIGTNEDAARQFADSIKANCLPESSVSLRYLPEHG